MLFERLDGPALARHIHQTQDRVALRVEPGLRLHTVVIDSAAQKPTRSGGPQ